MTSYALHLHNLGVRFGGIDAVRNVNLSIQPGDKHAILGPNGAGKSSLFNLIAGDYLPTSGRVHMFDCDITRLPIYKRSRMGLGRTYQTSSLFHQLTVVQHLYLALRGGHRGRMSFRPLRHKSDDHQTALALAEQVGLTTQHDRLVADLSHGEQRQLELGLALAGEPRIILLDEPAAGLSQVERQRLLTLLKTLPETLTVLIIEHDMDVALEAADLVTVMHNGQIIVTQTPDDIMCNHEVHDLYMGKHHAQ